MSICKAAFRIVARHPIYVGIYLVILSFAGVFIVQSMISSASSGEGPFQSYEATVAVIDRDGSDVSRALADHLGGSCEIVVVADDRIAMQDALATGYVDCLFVVPEGFGEGLLDAARVGGMPGSAEDAGTGALRIEASYGFASAAGALANEDAQAYLSLVAQAAALDASADSSECIERADAASAEHANVEEVDPATAASEASNWFAQYLLWGTYTLTASISVCVGLLMRAFNRPDVRRRMIGSPLSTMRLGLQLALASVAVAAAGWAACFGIGLAFFGWALAGVSPIGVGLTLLASLSFSLVPCALGVLLGQMGAGEEVFNAVGNIVGMTMSFLGGAWISLDLLAPEVQAVSLLSPSRWYAEAVYGALALDSGAAGSALADVLSRIGVVVLFALAVVLVSLAIGRARMRSSEAGGNAAAAR